MRLTADDHARIADAIATAEQSTSGEIFCVMSRRASAYRDVALGWAVACALLAPLVLIPLGFDAAWIPGLADSWETGHLAAREVTVGRTLATYAVLQAAIFVGAFLFASIPAVSRWLTPRAVRRARTRQAAMHQFLAHGLHVTEARTGVLIFAAFADRQVEVIADEGIHARVDQDVWAEAVSVLTRALADRRPADGFVSAIKLCGAVLAPHFPPTPDNPNELADRLVEI